MKIELLKTEEGIEKLGEKVSEKNTVEFFNGFGGFVDMGREYEILLEGETRPPAPWINVIANNKNFGFQVSESGAGFTWAYNSRENKITPWSNDPIMDQASEILYIRDDVSYQVMTPMSLGRTDRGTYRVRHGFGYTKFSHVENEIDQNLTVFCPMDEPVKLWELDLTNHSEYDRYLTLSYYVEWVLGVDKELTSPYILTDYNNEYEYLYAKSIYNYDYRKHQAFLFSSEMITGYTVDRKEFLGLKGSTLNPQGIQSKLSCCSGVCYDACGVIQVSVAIRPGETKKVVFALGYSEDTEQIHQLRKKYTDIAVLASEKKKVETYWNDILNKIQVRTSDKAIDYLLNGWLLYQTLSCRINARAAFYQCGGAYGFRDQIQDTLALQYTRPDLLRNQILTAASRQFEEGDVQHWWHPPTGVGVRTRISDDLLWLPYATAAYIRTTGDESVLDEQVAYIKSAVLTPEQKEIMITPEPSSVIESLYEHCKKTIERTGYGIHGLPLMGGGDWNDGMNEVGIKGSGESVWLGWFLYKVLEDFIPVCEKRQDTQYAKTLRERQNSLKENLEAHTWDGEWYLRAFYDDHAKLGSKENDECRIDSISQSWSVISGAAQEERAKKAMESAVRYLVDEKESMSLLLSPPFDKTAHNPGYIKNYFPGIRENGGQYSHAAVWLAIASTMIGDSNLARTLFTMLNPIHTTKAKKDALKYEKEPYVMVADISLNAPYSGRGGWSWYTGSAGWMYQGLLKYYLGFWLEQDEMLLRPCVPATFGTYEIKYLHGGTKYEIKVIPEANRPQMEVTLDGTLLDGNRIQLVDDGEFHYVECKC